ncbi:unnamed protein product [Parascedosporium putredinis]|uniref:Uncharacterized protein n=1 Tax=Parascedosporium putredinis TaxID=1442378 RepID=A0A9P1M6Y5_9PEZI|nr:unnamed protein product [Parascedosporium putredinis]CAI7989369.1 unnamed protein product [Parascedosporium putredinis]
MPRSTQLYETVEEQECEISSAHLNLSLRRMRFPIRDQGKDTRRGKECNKRLMFMPSMRESPTQAYTEADEPQSDSVRGTSNKP